MDYKYILCILPIDKYKDYYDFTNVKMYPML